MFRGKGEPLCRKVRGMLSEYIDNRLDSENKSLVERHLETCEACSKELESLRMTVQLLHRVPEVSVPRSFTVTAPAAQTRERFRASEHALAASGHGYCCHCPRGAAYGRFPPWL